ADDARPAILLAVPFLLVGGVERLFSHLCAYLRRRGYRIVIVSSLAFDPAYGDSSAWFGDATDEIFHLPRFLDPGRWRAFVDYLLESRRVQILWIVGSAFFYDLLAEIKAAHPELKVIDSLFNTVGHTTNNRKHQRWIDLNLVENQEVEQWLLDAGEPAERIRLIPSGVDLERYRPAVKSEAALAALGIPAGAFVVGYSGRLAIEKRPQRFVALADRLRGDPRLVFLMTGAGPLEGQVRMQIEGLRPGHRLQLLGNVPDVQEVLALYDVLVLPSSLDGRPVVVLESLAMGIPVVASKVGGLPELVRDGESGFLCEPEDFEGCARRIRWLADHPQEHARMKLAARRFAEAALGDTAMCAAYEAILRELLAAAGGDAPPQREGGGSPAEEELGERRRRGLRGETEQRAQP
ncbi:MAG TPA: glycosyltransferase family 4 protein, partial [Thermoanaerobaculia bacterium]|nr:glycosyltransferase family 4 protein [Thermoanaerobaculia bacterium]